MTLLPNYLDVRYAVKDRPFTDYPDKLCRHLADKYLSEHRGGVLMDLGCGRGEFLDAFGREGFSAFGVDREVSKACKHPVRLCDLESQPLPVAEGSVDVIFNKSVLEHVWKITWLLNECHRVLRPGGLMVSLVPDWKAQWSHFFDDWTHIRPFTLTGLRQCLQSHHFEVVEAKRFRQLPLLWAHPYLRPLSDCAALLPSRLKQSKWVRFSKEWMLLAVVRKPSSLNTNNLK